MVSFSIATFHNIPTEENTAADAPNALYHRRVVRLEVTFAGSGLVGAENVVQETAHSFVAIFQTHVLQ